MNAKLIKSFSLIAIIGVFLAALYFLPKYYFHNFELSNIKADLTSQNDNNNTEAAIDENAKTIILTADDQFKDMIDDNLFFTRTATSGPGTGYFTGNELQFNKGSCSTINTENNPKWSKTINICERAILDSEWCAQNVNNLSELYNLKFLSWTQGAKGKNRSGCFGQCQEYNNQTAYIRTLVEKQ